MKNKNQKSDGQNYRCYHYDSRNHLPKNKKIKNLVPTNQTNPTSFLVIFNHCKENSQKKESIKNLNRLLLGWQSETKKILTLPNCKFIRMK
jgi:hypothetical protein